jgi:cyclophilin family peptidyl-prolyl cis-trans isomerase
VIQGGDPVGTGTGGPGYSLPDEVSPNPSYGPGTLAMANTGQPNTGGSQFFLITGPKGHGLDNCNQPGQTCYAIFGHVTAGLDVAQRIQHLPVKGFKPGDQNADGPPKQAVYIDTLTVAKKGGKS